MWRLSLLLLASSALAAVVAGGWIALRLAGMIHGPPEYFAEVLIACTPIALFLLGMLGLLAARNHELPRTIPKTLPHRLYPASSGSFTVGLVAFAALTTTVALFLSFLFIVSLFPRTWSDSWVCEPNDEGGSSCNLVDGFWYQHVLFLLLCLIDPLSLLAGPVLVVASIVVLTRRIRAPDPIVEVDTQGVCPGGQINVHVAQHGNGDCGGVRLWLQCLEVAQWSAGSSTSSESRVIYEVPILQHPGGAFSRTTPILAHCMAVVPVDGMHSFKSNNNEIRWVLRVLCKADGRKTDEDLRILVGGVPMQKGMA